MGEEKSAVMFVTSAKASKYISVLEQQTTINSS